MVFSSSPEEQLETEHVASSVSEESFETTTSGEEYSDDTIVGADLSSFFSDSNPVCGVLENQVLSPPHDAEVSSDTDAATASTSFASVKGIATQEEAPSSNSKTGSFQESGATASEDTESAFDEDSGAELDRSSTGKRKRKLTKSVRNARRKRSRRLGLNASTDGDSGQREERQVSEGAEANAVQPLVLSFFIWHADVLIGALLIAATGSR